MKRHGPKTGASRPLSLNWILRVRADQTHSPQVTAVLGMPHTVLRYDKTGTELLHIYEAKNETPDVGNFVKTLMIPLTKAEALKSGIPCTVQVHLRVHENDGMPLTLPPSLLQMLGRLEAALELCVDAEGE